MFNKRIGLKDGRTVMVQSLQHNDKQSLYSYLQGLSDESQSRFGPHSFDPETVKFICDGQDNNTYRYVAIDDAGIIVAYMIIKKGLVDGDKLRLLQKGILFNESVACTFAPSVADTWQSSGLGSAMYGSIENNLLTDTSYRQVILWGGVQVTNEKAVRFYEKHGFIHLGAFRHDGKDNYDMMKMLIQ